LLLKYYEKEPIEGRKRYNKYEKDWKAKIETLDDQKDL